MGFKFASFILISLLSLSPTLWSVEPLTFTKGQSLTAIEIVDKLAGKHYRNQPLSDEMSDKFLDNYLDTLDPNKSFFLEGDVKSFEKYRFKMDDFLENGRLQVGFDIFHIYRSRVSERLESVIATLEDPKISFDFSKDESLNIDTENAAWPKTVAEADELWRKRVKSSVLNLKLADKTVVEAKDVLIKRYKNQLKRVKQQDRADAFEVLINSLTQLYDPHTSYLSPRTLENFNISMSLSLEGIGAVLQTEDEYTKVVRLISAGPADKQGQLKPADKIISVGQGTKGELVDVVGWRLDEVVDLIRGEKNTIVRLEVLSKSGGTDSTKVISINRDKVKLEEQAAQKAVFELSDGDELYKIGVIDIPTFYIDFDAHRARDPNYKSTTRDVRRLLRELEREQVDGIVLDLRNNGGGSLQEATTLTDLFIDQGTVVQIRQTNQTISRHHRSRSKAFYRGPLVVLINRLSASASEIFAGAIQDYGRGLIIGTPSFGKGTVQSLAPVHEGQLKITESKFYRVSGESTQNRGVIPDLFMPALIDAKEVGESSYDYALPWDKIHPVSHAKYFNLKALVPYLRTAHKKRVVSDPDFIYLQDQFELVQTNRNKKQLSLNEKTRRKQKQEMEAKALEIENKRRKTKGLNIFKTVDELEEDNEDKEVAQQADPNRIDPTNDPLLTESGHILMDYIQIAKKQRTHQVARKFKF